MPASRSDSDTPTLSAIRLSRRLAGAAMIAALALFAVAPFGGARAAEEAVKLPDPALDLPAPDQGIQTAVFAGGCFWGVQAVFQHVKGVTLAVSGYSGGMLRNPSYEQVGTGTTGHAESVEVKFDPREVSFGQLLKVFFSVAHNPTQLNYQGPDHGTQYRSAVFYMNDAQKKVTEAYIAQLDKARVFPAKIVTQVAPNTGFFEAEAYHQDFAIKHPGHPYIVFNDAPKVENLKRLFPTLYRDKPVTVAAR